MTDTYELPDKEIQRMAAKFIAADWTPDFYYRDMDLVAFARAIERAAIQQERERCARLCEAEEVENVSREDVAYNLAIGHCAAAIRAG
jgi:hypothetical protein